MSDENDYDPFAEECPECGSEICQCGVCEECHGTGRVPVRDGYYEYIGDGCVPCQECWEGYKN